MERAVATPAVQSDEAGREAEVIASGLLHADRAMAIHAIVWRAAQMCRATMASATIVSGGRQIMLANVGLSLTEIPRDFSFCAHAIRTPERIMCVPDARADPRFADNPLVTGDPHIRFYAGAPLVTPTGHALGTLCVLDPAPRAPLKPREEDALRALAGEVMARSLRR